MTEVFYIRWERSMYMQLIGETIEHQLFGKGVVTALEKGIITIDFVSGGKKSFVYPDAFEAYLVPQDSGSQQQINDILVKRKMEEKQREIENFEHQQIAHLRAMKIPSAGQAVFDLDRQEENNPFVSGKCSTGCYLSGYSKGQARVPDRVHFNTMCILTRCQEGQPENTRQILGVAMTEESFVGEECREGWIPLSQEFRLKLKNPIAIWPYMQKEPQKAWGHTTFKYISNKIGEEILHDIRVQLTGTEDEKKAKDFYKFYCACNRLTQR